MTDKLPIPLTRAERVNADISALLRARNTCLWVRTTEETRVERALTESAATAGYKAFFWDCATGITDSAGRSVTPNGDPSNALAWLRESRERSILVMRDLHKWLDPIVLRGVRSLARQLQTADRNQARAIVILTPSGEIPPELAGCATVVEYPIPDRAEMSKILDDIITALPPDLQATAAPNGTRDAAIDAAVGLSAEEAANCYARSLVTTRTIDPAMVANEKKRVIAREKVLTWHDPDPRGMAGVGGLDVLKAWLTTRKAAFGAKARAYGLPSPKGCMLVGVPGCGKSLTAKCIASAWGVPLLRLDLGALRSKYVGESEANIRKALQVAEAVSPCVLWLDEIEKAMAGSTGAQGDGGVSADALGAVLSWMQERSGSVFVVATANDVRSLPPELLRKGRFDEVFWVDLPTHVERAAIAGASLAQHGRTPADFDLGAIASVTEGFTGAEIAAIVPDALYQSFADGERPVTTGDLLDAARTVVPLAKTAADKIDGLRAWAKGRARPASTPENETSQGKGRALDM